MLKTALADARKLAEEHKAAASEANRLAERQQKAMEAERAELAEAQRTGASQAKELEMLTAASGKAKVFMERP